jgi:hypothetical protein
MKACSKINKLLISNGLLASLIALVSIFFSGCDNEAKEEYAEHAQKEYLNYMNTHVVPAEKKRVSLVLASYEVIDDIHQSNSNSYKQKFLKKEIIPEFSNLRSKLNSLDIKTKEVSELNEKYVEALDCWIKLYEYEVLWFEPGADRKLKIKVSEAQADAVQKVDSFAIKKQRLAKQLGVFELKE